MTIKRVLRKRENGKRVKYIDETTEFHSLAEVKDFCYNNFSSTACDDVCNVFVITDTNEEIMVACSSIKDEDGEECVNLMTSF